MSQLIILVVLTPLLAGVLASLLVLRTERGTRVLVVLCALAQTVVVTLLAVDVAGTGGSVYYLGGWIAPVGIVLVADPLTVFFLLLVSVGHLLFLAHAIAEERGERKELWTLSALLVTGLSGMILAGDLFNLFVFMELASVTTTGLITHKQRAEGAGVGFMYLMFASVSGLLFLAAIVIIYAEVGSLTIAEVSARIGSMSAGAYRAAAGLMIASLGMKFGLVPLHLWQAPAYSAAGSSVSGLLSGVGMKAYLYVLIRLLVHTLHAGAVLPQIGLLVLVLGLVNILAGHLLALAENELKRLLAFSSVAHVGYILVALGTLLSPADVASGVSSGLHTAAVAGGALLHIVYHALIKTTLFYSGRCLVGYAGTARVEGLRAVAHAEPVGFAAFMLAALALVGIPPASGFFSKWRIA